MMMREAAVREVERAVEHARTIACVGVHDPRVRDAACGEAFARHAHHASGDVDADHLAGGHATERLAQLGSRAAAKVEHARVCGQVRPKVLERGREDRLGEGPHVALVHPRDVTEVIRSRKIARRIDPGGRQREARAEPAPAHWRERVAAGRRPPAERTRGAENDCGIPPHRANKHGARCARQGRDVTVRAPLGSPGPRADSVLGHLLQFDRDRLGFLERCARHGDVVRLRFGPKRVLLFADPTLVRSVLVSHAAAFRKGYSVRLLRFLLGDGLLTSDGERWLARRRAAQPALSRERVAAAVPLMRGCVERTLAGWRDGATRDAYTDMTALTMTIAARVVLGVDVAADPHAAQALIAAAETTGRERPRGILRFLGLPPTLTDRRVRRVIRDLDGFIYALIAERRSAPADDDALSLLVRTQPGVPDRHLRDDAVTLFFGAYDTTANALAWALHLLACHPDVQRRVADELATELGSREPDADDLARLRLTFAVVHEALRLYPSAWAQSREATRDCDIDGVLVRRGTTVIVSQWLTHRDERQFARPLDFEPDRWLAPDPPTRAFFPFGLGARRCIGAGLAMTECAVTLAWILRRFELVPAGPPPRPAAVITLRPSGPLLVGLRARAPAPTGLPPAVSPAETMRAAADGTAGALVPIGG